MKFIAITFFLFISSFSFAQTITESRIDVKLFLPAHLKSTILPKDKLTVYLISEDDSAKFRQEVKTATRMEDNVYAFTWGQYFYFRIVFSIGGYSYNMACVDNREGQATDNYSFNILLEKVKFNKETLKYIRLCPRGD